VAVFELSFYRYSSHEVAGTIVEEKGITTEGGWRMGKRYVCTL